MLPNPPPPDHAAPRRLRWLAIGVVVAMAALAWPLADAWRHQGLELRTAFDARQALATTTQVVRTQRALVAHRPLAAAVLAGSSEQEPARLRQQQAVDGDLGALVARLESQRLHRALDEADQLRLDWSGLLEGLGRRQFTAAASDTAHDLLIEQTYVVMDLVGSTSALSGQAGRAFTGDEWLLATRTLSRHTVDLALARSASLRHGSDAASARAGALSPLQADARRTARAAAEVLRAADAIAAADADEPPPDPAFLRALVALEQHARALADTPPGPRASDGGHAGPPDILVQRALAAALEAQAALAARLDARLAARAATLESAQRLVAAAGLLILLIGAVAARWALPGAAPTAEHSAGPAADDVGAMPRAPGRRLLAPGPSATGAESRAPALDLLERLRHAGPGTLTDPGATPGTMPGADRPATPPANR